MCVLVCVYMYEYALPLDEDSLAIYPRSIYTEENTTVTFQCFSVEPVIWKFNEKDLPENVQEYRLFKAGKYSIQINGVKMHNSGNYECQGKNLKKHYYSIGQLIVKSKLFNNIEIESLSSVISWW